MTIETTLAERGGRYGDFEQHAVISQALQDVMRAQAGWARLKADQKQALTVMADKVARMLNGDPDYRDNWHDVVGYAKLVDDRMARDEELAARIDSGWTDAAIKAAALPADPLMCGGCLSGCWVCQPGSAPKADPYPGRGGVMLDLEHPGVSGW